MATMTKNVIPVSQEDFLDSDPPLRGQNYVCLSFISPEDIIQKKEHYFFEKFLESFSTDVQELFNGLQTRYPKDADNLRMLKERYSYFFDKNVIGDEYAFYVANHGKELQEAFDTKNDFKTSIRGIKVRGVFDTIREAQIRAEVLKKLDGKFHVYVAEVGCWCPWSPNPEEIGDQEFAETHLNTMMKHYKDNQIKKDIFYEERKRELQFMKVKKDMEEEDSWMANKASTSAPVDIEAPPVVEPETPVVETPVVETPVVETPAVETPVVETPVVENATVATVTLNGREVRSYSVADHGDEFVTLAETYVSTREGEYKIELS